MIKVDVTKIAYFPPSKGYAVILSEWDGTRELPIVVGSTEAQAIAFALENVKMPRPLTHDLTANIIKELDAYISKVTIYKLQGETFLANIELVSGGQIIKIDSRPSDAVAIALRTDTPIFVAENLLNHQHIEFPEDENQEEDVQVNLGAVDDQTFHPWQNGQALKHRLKVDVQKTIVLHHPTYTPYIPLHL